MIFKTLREYIGPHYLVNTEMVVALGTKGYETRDLAGAAIAEYHKNTQTTHSELGLQHPRYNLSPQQVQTQKVHLDAGQDCPTCKDEKLIVAFDKVEWHTDYLFCGKCDIGYL